MKENIKTQGGRIKHCMEMAGVKTQELAKKLKISPSEIYRLIHNKRSTSRHLIRIASALNTTPEYLQSGAKRYAIKLVMDRHEKEFKIKPGRPFAFWPVPLVNWTELETIEKADDIENISERNYTEPSGNPGLNSIAVIVDDNSMERLPVDNFRVGDILIFDPEKKAIPNKHFVLARNEKTKEIIFGALLLEKSKKTVIQPNNPQHPITPVTADIKLIATLIARKTVYE